MTTAQYPIFPYIMDDSTYPSDFPYGPSLSVRITAHVPPQHVDRVDSSGRVEVDYQWMAQHEQLDVVLRAPPLEGEKSRESPKHARMVFIEPIRLTPCRGAQLFLCEVLHDESSKPERWVAKIYDPLYYTFLEIDHDNPKKNSWNDVTYAADYGYSKESATYTYFERKGLGGTVVPRYGGSWTFEVPLAHIKGNEVATCLLQGKASSCTDSCDRVLPPAERKFTRPVRMILIEHIRGETMRQILNKSTKSNTPLRQDWSMSVWAQFLHVYGHMRQVSVMHDDLVPRNVMVCTSTDTSQAQQHQKQQLSPCSTCAQPPHRVVWIDFDRAEISPNHVFPGNLKRPVNPIRFYWDLNHRPDFREWWGSWNHDDNRRRREWLLEHFGGVRADEYETLDWKNYTLESSV